jgi:hypothetical protein
MCWEKYEKKTIDYYLHLEYLKQKKKDEEKGPAYSYFTFGKRV